ncbi:unnamed protein product [Spirodela intermedia]|uniref:tryptophan synthase n=1 Tax=Spirodela intermedia TaxID=51605 RepID=A0A7I8INE1_SPIIN|nr:unnamed protein product [Spirodela intermedia]CAA6658972.1 unnamed protein product [Spirodela intermedia]
MALATGGFHCARLPLKSRALAVISPRSLNQFDRSDRAMAFIPYLTAGDPDLRTTSAALRMLDACGSDVIELGVPHWDPIMDGPVIQRAFGRALASGADVDGILAMLSEVVPELSCPITLFSYFHPVQEYGVSKFLAAMKEVGARGLMVPDLPLEETETLRMEAYRNKIEMVFHTTPGTRAGRTREIAKASEGFLYLTTHSGTTGARSSLNPELQFVLQRLREDTSKPIAVGFGISEPEHVKQLSAWGADGVIVGSALVQRLGEAVSPSEGLRAMEAHVRSLMAALP